MKQELRDYKDYTERIYRELKELDPEKYQHITKQSIKNHLIHINHILTYIISTTAVEFMSSFFELKKGYKRYRNRRVGRAIMRKYQRERQKELAAKVPFDNIADRLNITTCIFRSSWRGIIYEKDTHTYKWNRLAPFDVKKRMNRKY